ncbi:APC family permease [Microbacterium sp.]|uniref:APC family permease n=1 Tax=Microbacterium sp. TaxID=51671 RepID=UPI0039E67064
MTSMHHSPAEHDPGLSRRRLGFGSITFMIIAASAPLTVVAGGVTTSYAVTGSLGVPLGFLLIAVILTAFAVGYTAMSRFVTNAGAFYAYVAQGLNRALGVGGSLLALVSYNAMQIGIYGLFGFQISAMLEAKNGTSTPWWLWVFLCIVVVGVLGVNRVDLSAKVLGTLVALEFVVVIVFDIVALGVAPEGVSTAALNPAALFGPALGLVLVFGVAAFMGFESGAIYGEEAKDPQRTVARATYAAVAIIGLFYAFSAWAFSVGVGPSAIVDASRESGPDLMFVFMTDHVGVLLADIMSLLFITSLFAALQAFHNAVARYLYSLGREGVLPHHFGRTNRAGAPWAGSLAQSVLAVVVVAGFAIAGDALGGAKALGGAPEILFPVLTLFTWLTNTGAAGLVLLMGITAIAAFGYFRKDSRGLSVWTTSIAPLASAAALLAIFVLVLGNFPLMLGQTEPDATTIVLPALLIVALVGGIIWGAVLKRRDPAVYARIGHGTEPGAYGTALIDVVGDQK